MKFNLNNLSDDELDDLFRQSAEQTNLQYDEDAWSVLEKQLDQFTEKPTAGWLKKEYLSLALLFTLSLISYFGYQYWSKSNNTLANDTTVTQDVDVDNKNDLAGSSNKKANNSNSIANTDKPVNQTEIGVNTDTINDKQKVIENKANVKENSNSLSANAKTSNNSLENSTKQNKKNKAETLGVTSSINSKKERIAIKSELVTSQKQSIQSIQSKPNTTNNLAQKFGDDVTIGNENRGTIALKSQDKKIKKSKSKLNSENRLVNENDGLALSSKPNKSVDQSLPTNIKIGDVENMTGKAIEARNENAIEMVRPSLPLMSAMSPIAYKPYRFANSINVKPATAPKMQAKAKPDIFDKGIAIRAALSPDISYVKGNEIEGMGNNMAMLLEYRFAKRWVLQTGFMKSKKVYDAYPDQYQWPSNWGKPSSPLMSIDAECSVLEIPINLRYDITSSNKRRIFSSVGLSTYDMKKEVYHYNYQNNADPNLKWHKWQGKTGMYNWSVVNISAGFEQKIARNFSLQVEPFGRIPLREIGFGKVPLRSYGLMFSGKYQFLNFNKK